MFPKRNTGRGERDGGIKDSIGGVARKGARQENADTASGALIRKRSAKNNQWETIKLEECGLLPIQLLDIRRT